MDVEHSFPEVVSPKSTNLVTMTNLQDGALQEVDDAGLSKPEVVEEKTIKDYVSSSPPMVACNEATASVPLVTDSNDGDSKDSKEAESLDGNSEQGGRRGGRKRKAAGAATAGDTLRRSTRLIAKDTGGGSQGSQPSKSSGKSSRGGRRRKGAVEVVLEEPEKTEENSEFIESEAGQESVQHAVSTEASSSVASIPPTLDASPPASPPLLLVPSQVEEIKLDEITEAKPSEEDKPFYQSNGMGDSLHTTDKCTEKESMQGEENLLDVNEVAEGRKSNEEEVAGNGCEVDEKEATEESNMVQRVDDKKEENCPEE